jgi:transposase
LCDLEHSFHLHGQDAKGKAVFRKKPSRKQSIEFIATFHVCTVIMEACAGSHPMARKLAALGHTVKLISPENHRAAISNVLYATLRENSNSES